MQSTIKQQADALHKVTMFLMGHSTDILKPSQDELNALTDLFDTMVALKIVDLENILSVLMKNSPSAEEFPEWERAINTIKSLIEALR